MQLYTNLEIREHSCLDSVSYTHLDVYKRQSYNGTWRQYDAEVTGTEKYQYRRVANVYHTAHDPGTSSSHCNINVPYEISEIKHQCFLCNIRAASSPL